MEREKLGSRMGFILLSAGCAIGIGNVWRFPYVAGQYGGGVFVIFYLFFLVIMGACYDNGVCGRTRKQEKHYKKLPCP